MLSSTGSADVTLLDKPMQDGEGQRLKWFDRLVAASHIREVQ
jgi:hypothetical protein